MNLKFVVFVYYLSALKSPVPPITPVLFSSPKFMSNKAEYGKRGALFNSGWKISHQLHPWQKPKKRTNKISR